MKYQVSQVQQWGDELDALPAPEPGSRMVGKREAVLLLAEKLQSAARRGVSRAALLEALEAKGLKVHIDLLREALKHAGKAAGKGPPRAVRRARSAESVAPGEHTEKSGTTGGLGDVHGSERAPVDEVSPAGLSAGPQGAAPSEQSADAARTERRPAKDDATGGASTGSGERVGANAGSAQTARTAAAPTEPRSVGEEPQGSVGGAAAARAPGPQAHDEVPREGASKAAEAVVAEAGGPSAGRTAAGLKADGKAVAAPAARGSFVPRSDSDNI